MEMIYKEDLQAIDNIFFQQLTLKHYYQKKLKKHNEMVLLGFDFN